MSGRYGVGGNQITGVVMIETDCRQGPRHRVHGCERAKEDCDHRALSAAVPCHRECMCGAKRVALVTQLVTQREFSADGSPARFPEAPAAPASFRAPTKAFRSARAPARC